MNNFNKDEFRDYLSTKVATATAQTYASDMLVCVNAFGEMATYKGRNLEDTLKNFLENKKTNKNYLYDEFLDALVKVGSSDTGLYNSLSSKAKHYLAMKNDNNETKSISVTIKLTWENQESSEEGELEKVYVVDINESYETAYDVINFATKDEDFINNVLNETKNLFTDMSIIQLYFSTLTVEDRTYIYCDYIDGDDEYYELSSCRFFFPDGNDRLEFFMRD